MRFWAPGLQDCFDITSQVAFEPTSVLIRVSWSKVNEAAILGEGGTLHIENITRYKTTD
jgi:hypothetical protein